MNPEELEELLAELVQAVTQVMQSGEELSDEFQGLLAETLNNLVTRIDELRNQQTNTGAQAPITPPLEPGPYPSSNVNAFKYDPRNGTLFVKFHGKDSADSGPVYKYDGVPRNIYDVFSKGRVAPKTSGQNQYHRWIRGITPSLGASLYALIRNGGFPYQRMS
jgi:hypothetical protein